MKILDYVVVGSGCSGAIVAKTLVDAGVEVTMLDVGAIKSRNNSLPKGKKFSELRHKDRNQYKYFIGDRGQGISWGEISKGAQVTPPRQYMTNYVDNYIPLSSKTFSPLESLGYGGLGIGWGLQCWEYSDEDLARVGLDSAKIRKAYNTVGRWIGISATNDDASRYTIGQLKGYQPSALADKNHRYIQLRYLKRRKLLQKQGVYIGRTPLALITKSIGARKAYRYLDTDFYSDGDESAWRPWITVNQLRKKRNFHYINNLLVTSFKENNGIVTINALNVKSGEKESFQCRNLILASGALGTARIVMRSQGGLGSKVPVLSNPHTYIPCIQPTMIGKGYEKKKLGFGQLSYFIDPEGKDSGVSVASSYSYQSLMLFRIIAQMPFNFADGRILSRFLTPGLIIMIAQHPDSYSSNKYLKLVEDKTSPTGDKIDAHYSLSSEDVRNWDARERKYTSVMRKLHTFPIKRVKTEHGSGIHYAGTLPFSDKKSPMRLDRTGRLHNTKHVYVADSSGFQYLPAKGLTFTLMANAHVVAKNVLKENDEKE